MSPAALVDAAVKKGIRILALTDHNSARNLPAFDDCCRAAGIYPIFGLEVTTQEEVHVLALFEKLSIAEKFGSFIESLLPDIPNMPELFGDQVYVDKDENILGEVEKSLLQASDIPFESLIEEILSWDGLAIPAHIDRPSFSAVSQLGFLPDIQYTAVETVSYPCPYATYANSVIRGSDAHFLEQVGTRSWEFEADTASYEALKFALANKCIFV